MFNPCKVICFTEQSVKSESVDIVAATGVVLPPNPLKVILKRIILTGYPLKCHKKKCVARYMFFEPKDIKYFKPVEITTKHGLKVSRETKLVDFSNSASTVNCRVTSKHLSVRTA